MKANIVNSILLISWKYPHAVSSPTTLYSYKPAVIRRSPPPSPKASVHSGSIHASNISPGTPDSFGASTAALRLFACCSICSNLLVIFTLPEKRSVKNIYKRFILDQNIGGCFRKIS